jgi:putative ABC transport system substrate-binding protein
MRRRDLIERAVAAVALVPFGAGAQPGLPTVGYFSSRSPEAERPLRTGFLEGLDRAGFVVGRNVAIEYRFAEGRFDRLPSIAAELVRLPAAVLVATDAGAAVAATQTTATIPVVFTTGPDPVQRGLVSSLNRPAGNATGVHVFTTEVIPKRLGLLRELLPQPGLIAALFNPATSSSQQQVHELEAAANASGQPILICGPKTMMRSRGRSRPWRNAKRAVFFTDRRPISR